ncbi:MAG TPA: AAA domain-containing protein, partial [Pirellulales bacterium]|nr:AAA domain-containing protein [Pirellulales bacterium]
MPPALNADEHFSRLAALLELESHAQARRGAEQARRFSGAAAERTGNSLVELRIADESAGLGGRYVLRLVKQRRSPLPWTRLDVGSPVVLSPDGERPAHERQDHSARGVICQRDDEGISLALAQFPEHLADFETWRIDLGGDDVAAQRQRLAMLRAKNARGNRLAQLRDVLLGLKPPRFDAEPPLTPLDAGLNEIQQGAVRMALAARDVALIHGPPGTGKTTTVVEFIRQAVRQEKKVLACAPSNLAVDNLLERLLAGGERAVRLGHPARVLPQLRANTLDLLVEEHADVRLAHKLVKEAMQLFRRADRFTRARPAPGEKRELRHEAKSLLEDARRLEYQAVQQILDQADILCATTTALDDSLLGDRRFDLGVIDEACQSIEPGCWIPLGRCDKLVLAGDHCQLPPTILSREAAAGGFGVSLFERLMSARQPEIARRLTVQYRMHQAIMEFSSREFYDGQLQADSSVVGHLLTDLPGVAPAIGTDSPCEFLDTAGAGFDEELEPDGESRRNPQEAELAIRTVQALIERGVPPAAIAVISPYSAQVRLLRAKLNLPAVEIDSVDGFQGREKEAIVISLVRSNPQCELGFLSELRRMNVALTRARRKLRIIGDSATLGGDPFYARLLEHC